MLDNVEEGARQTRAMLQRFHEVRQRLGSDDSVELLAEMGRLQEQLDYRDAWDIDSQIEQAMDPLRAHRWTRTCVRSPAANGAGLPCAESCSGSPTCFCSTSRPITWTPSASGGWSSILKRYSAPWSRSPTIGASSTTWPTGSLSWTAADVPVRRQLLDLPGDQAARLRVEGQKEQNAKKRLCTVATGAGVVKVKHGEG